MLYLPYTIENITIRIDSNINIWNYNLVLFGFFLISEEGVRHPNFPGIRHCQVFNAA